MRRSPGNRGVPTSSATLLAILILAACEGDPARSVWTVSEESLDGLTRVVNTPPATAPPITLVGQEEVRVGTAGGDGPVSFGRLRSVTVLPDGRFAVADAIGEEVHLFDRGGGYLRTFGGTGSGPGDLRGLQGVYTDHEGKLRVPEQMNARLSVFHPDSGFVTSYPLQFFSYGFFGPWPAAVDSTGRAWVESSGEYGERRFWNMVRVYDPEMNQLDSIPYREYTDRSSLNELPGAWRLEIRGGFTWVGVPFYPAARAVLTPTGEFWGSTEGRPRLELARWTPAGDTSLVLTSGREPDPVTSAERDSAMAALRERHRERALSLRSLDASRVPAAKPPLYGLSLDDLGRPWVRITAPTADSTVYDVFGGDGRWAETVYLALRVDPYIPPVIRGDTVWAVVVDDLDVQYVVRAGLHRDGEGVGPASPQEPR